MRECTIFMEIWVLKEASLLVTRFLVLNRYVVFMYSLVYASLSNSFLSLFYCIYSWGDNRSVKFVQGACRVANKVISGLLPLLHIVCFDGLQNELQVLWLLHLVFSSSRSTECLRSPLGSQLRNSRAFYFLHWPHMYYVISCSVFVIFTIYVYEYDF